MLDTATNPQLNQNSTSPNPTVRLTTNTQTEINNLLASVEKFRKTGLVEESEVEFAKTEILPKLGYSTEQINDLGPVGIMVKLQKEADKKGLNSSGVAAAQSKPVVEPIQPSPETKPTPTSVASANPIPTSQSSTSETATPKIPLETNVDQATFEALTKQVSQMTDKLSSDIDSEIKRQLEEKKALEHAQEKVDTVLKEHKEISLPQEEKPTETPTPKLGLFHTKSEQPKDKVAIRHDVPYSVIQPEENPDQNIPADPLTASVDFALSSLKEGDQIGSEWILRKILTTSFGNKKSPFYELENHSGASWTLSPEEMRDILRSNILSKNTTPVKEIKEEKSKPPHGLNKPLEEKTEIKKPENNEDRSQVKINLAEEKVESGPEKLAEKMSPGREIKFEKPTVQKDGERMEIKKEEKPVGSHQAEKSKEPEHKFENKYTTHKESPPFKPLVKDHFEPKHLEVKPTVETHVEEAEKERLVPPKINHENIKFSPKQIEFLNKLHSDQNLWNVFTSFDLSKWEEFHELYENGKLISIGIDAHPLFDKLSSIDFGTLVDIRKGDSVSRLLSEVGYNLTWSKEDSEIFAVHLIANYKLLTDSARKVEISGVAAPSLPEIKDIIDLTIGAKNGNHESLHKLEEALSFLPLGAKFKLIKPDQIEFLKRYFKL